MKACFLDICVALFHSFYGYCPIVYVYHILFIHPSVKGHLGFFHVLVSVNSATMNTGVHVSFWITFISPECVQKWDCRIIW